MSREESINELKTMQALLWEGKAYQSLESYLAEKYGLKAPTKPQPRSLSDDKVISDPKWQKPFNMTLLRIKAWNIRVFGKWRGFAILAALIMSVLISVIKTKLPFYVIIILDIVSLAAFAAIFSYLLSLFLCWLPDPRKINKQKENLNYNYTEFAGDLEGYEAERDLYLQRSSALRAEYEQQSKTYRDRVNAFRTRHSIKPENMNAAYFGNLIDLMQQNAGITTIEAAKEIVDHYKADKEKREERKRIAEMNRYASSRSTPEPNIVVVQQAPRPQYESNRICLGCKHYSVITQRCKLGAQTVSGQCVNFE